MLKFRPLGPQNGKWFANRVILQMELGKLMGSNPVQLCLMKGKGLDPVILTIVASL